MKQQKKILVFENMPDSFESTGLYPYLVKNGYKWDFACSVNWSLSDVLDFGLDLLTGKYDTIATETFFGMPKSDGAHKEEEFEGGQLREIVMLLEAVLGKRKTPITVLFSQKLLDAPINLKYLKKYLYEDERFVRFSSTTQFVLEHKKFKLKLLNLIDKRTLR